MINTMVLAVAEERSSVFDTLTSGGVVMGLILLAVALGALVLDKFVGPTLLLAIVWFFGVLLGAVTLLRAIFGS